jgi:hypothetical protein
MKLYRRLLAPMNRGLGGILPPMRGQDPHATAAKMAAFRRNWKWPFI